MSLFQMNLAEVRASEHLSDLLAVDRHASKAL